MRTASHIIRFFILLSLFAGCKKEANDDVSFVASGKTPEQLTAMFDITQDNSGMVTITPNGTGAVSYDVFFGDNTTTPVRVQAGKSTTHKYAEGLYTVKLIGYAVNGKKSEATRQLTVSFKAPENLEFTITKDPVNNYKVQVSAKANFETNFKVYFGDVPNEIPVTFLEGDVVNHTYAAVGTYTVKVIAFSGGAASTEQTKQVTIVDPILLPLTFESTTSTYNFIGFDGGNVTVINNPQSNGSNTSSKVARMVKNAGQPWGGTVLTLGAPIDFSANKVFRMKVFSPRVGAKVLLKVENATNGNISFEKEVATTVANAWEDLVFDYTAINTANSYQKVVLIFDNGTMGDGSANFTFLFDDVRLTNQLPSSLLTLPVTFDDPNIVYTITDFGNAQTVNAADPVNAANKVKKTTKPNGAETWAGSTVGIGFATRLPISATQTKMSVRVYSPAAGIPVRLKIEDKNDNSRSVEAEKLTTVANAWETLVFDFAIHATGTAAVNFSYNYNLASIFFDFGSAGNGKVFYWDDLDMVAPNTGATLSIPLDFESSTLNYAFTNFDGGNVTVVNNPQQGGINNSSKVARMVKGAGQPWGGSFISLESPIDFSTRKTFKMKVFSPRAGAKVLLKVENLSNGNLNFEREVTTTVANGWEELTFDYSAINMAHTYQKVVVIFDNGTMGNGSADFTFLFDDIRLQ